MPHTREMPTLTLDAAKALAEDGVVAAAALRALEG
jgi:hypothetical protein